jgi:translation initiation factor 3 subunit D
LSTLPAKIAMSFVLPQLQDDGDRFGPSASNVPAAFTEIPYQSFNKSERLGTIIDWSSDGRGDRYGSTSNSAPFGGKMRAGAAESKDAAGGLYAYRHDEDEASFSLVAGATGARRGASGGLGNMGRGNFRGGRGGQRGGYGATGGRTGPGQGGYYSNATLGRESRAGWQPRGGAGRRGGAGGRGGYSSGWGGGREWMGREQRTREASVQAGPDWVVLEEIEFVRLGKLRLEVDTEDVETLCVPILYATTRLIRLPQLSARLLVRVRPGVRPRQHQDRKGAAALDARPLQPDCV